MVVFRSGDDDTGSEGGATPTVGGAEGGDRGLAGESALFRFIEYDSILTDQ